MLLRSTRAQPVPAASCSTMPGTLSLQTRRNTNKFIPNQGGWNTMAWRSGNTPSVWYAVRWKNPERMWRILLPLESPTSARQPWSGSVKPGGRSIMPSCGRIRARIPSAPNWQKRPALRQRSAQVKTASRPGPACHWNAAQPTFGAAIHFRATADFRQHCTRDIQDAQDLIIPIKCL